MSENCVKKRHNGSSRSIYCSLHELTCGHFLLIVMSFTRNRSTVTKMCWMKKTMDVISGIVSKESARVSPDSWRRRCNLVNASLKSARSLICSVFFFSKFIERDPPILFCVESTHLASFIRRNLSARPCPSGCRLLQFDQYWVKIHEILDRFGSVREFPQILSWCISVSNYGQ